jgi:hypothetical protein
MGRIIAGRTVHAYEVKALYDRSGTKPTSGGIEIDFGKAQRQVYYRTPIEEQRERNQMDGGMWQAITSG